MGRVSSRERWRLIFGKKDPRLREGVPNRKGKSSGAGGRRLSSASQQGAVRIEDGPSCARGCGEVKCGFRPIGEDLSEENALSPHRSVNRNQGHQILGSFALPNGTADSGRAIPLDVLHLVQFQAWNRRTVDPSVVEPVQGFLALIPQRRRQVLFKDPQYIPSRD